MKLFSILFFSLLFFLNTEAQISGKRSLTGKVIDDKSIPLEFVNAVLLKAGDSTLVKGAISDASGKYSFEEVEPANYIVMLSQVGYKKSYSGLMEVGKDNRDTEIPVIVLYENTVHLNEANVVAMKPFIERRLDMTVVNVENSIVDAGSNLLEILKRSPGIVVDNEGNISIKGKQGVLVLIDDKPTYLSTSDLYNLLKNTSADQLSLIEIISNPSARYDASGNSGVLNIRMRKKQNQGTNGSVTLSYGQGVYPDAGVGVNLNHRKEKFNLYGSYHYMYGFYFEEVELNRRFRDGDQTSSFLENTYDKGFYINHNYRGGIDYYLNDKQTLGIQARGYSSMNEDRTTSKTDVFNAASFADSSYVTINENDRKWQNFSANLNYRYNIDSLGRSFSSDIDYGRYDNKSDFRFTTDYYFPDSLKETYRERATNDQPAIIEIKTCKLDYVHPVTDKIKLEGGLKSSFVKTDSDVKYYNLQNGNSVLDSGKSNHFVYEENINAIYLSSSFEYNKFGLQLGLRAEQTIADGNQRTTQAKFHRDDLQLFPTVFLSCTLNEKHESRISYGRRIDRPGYHQLNPFRYFIDPYNYMEGNPDLKPQITNSYEVAHTFLKMLTLSLNYRQTSDAMAEISTQIDSTRTTFVRTENLDGNSNYGVNLSVPVQVFKWWYTSNNFNWFNNRYKGMSSVGFVDKQLSSYIINTYNSFSLPKSWGMELNAYYTSRMVWGTLLIDPRFSVSAGFRKGFMKDKMTLRINVNDIFHTESFNSVIQYQNVDADFKRVFDSQFVRFHVTWNFGKKTIPQVRQRDTGLQDEENRIKTGR